MVQTKKNCLPSSVSQYYNKMIAILKQKYKLNKNVLLNIRFIICSNCTMVKYINLFYYKI